MSQGNIKTGSCGENTLLGKDGDKRQTKAPETPKQGSNIK